MATSFVPCGRSSGQQLSQLWKDVYVPALEAAGKSADTPKTPEQFIRALFDEEFAHETLVQAGDTIYELVFTLGFSILPSVASQKGSSLPIQEALEMICRSLCVKDIEYPLLKMRLFQRLFNSLPADSKLRYSTLLSLLDYALLENMSHSLTNAFSELDLWISKWTLSDLEALALYRSIARHVQIFGSVQQYYEFLKQTLALGDSADEEFCRKLAPEAKKAVCMLVSDPSLDVSDELFTFQAVSLLETSDATLFQLYKLFVSGTIETMVSFLSANGRQLEEQGVSDASTCVLHQFRVYLLQSLNMEGTEFSFERIGEILQLKGDDEIEEFLVESAADKMLEIRINEQSRTVKLFSGVERSFNKNTWSALDKQLGKYLTSIKSANDSRKEN